MQQYNKVCCRDSEDEDGSKHLTLGRTGQPFDKAMERCEAVSRNERRPRVPSGVLCHWPSSVMEGANLLVNYINLTVNYVCVAASTLCEAGFPQGGRHWPATRSSLQTTDAGTRPMIRQLQPQMFTYSS